MSKTKKTVQIKENELVNLIDKIISEAVDLKKKEWIAEQESKKASLLENKILDLEKKFQSLTTKK